MLRCRDCFVLFFELGYEKREKVLVEDSIVSSQGGETLEFILHASAAAFWALEFEFLTTAI